MMWRGVSLGIILLMLGACAKEQPSFNLIRPTAGDRAVLVEEFSGVRCVNCPQGTAELAGLKEIYGDQLVVLTIHAGDFAFKFEDSRFDFTSPDAESLFDLLGNPPGYPSAVVDRRLEETSNIYQQLSFLWGSSIVSSLEQEAVVNIDQTIAYDAASREMSLQVDVQFFQNINSPVRLTVAIKEDDIIDPQADRAVQSGKVVEYVHKDVMRTLLTEPAGELLGESVSELDVISRSFTFTVPPEDGWWVAENLELVSFVTVDQPDLVGEVVHAVEDRLIN